MNEHWFSCTNINVNKHIKGSMRQRYPYYIIWEKNIVAIIHCCGARDIFLLLNDNQDTESQSQEIKIDVSGPIFTHKNINASMAQRYTYHTRWEKNLAILHIYGARAVFPTIL